MFRGIGDFLDKFRRAVPGDILAKRALAEEVRSRLGISLRSEDVRVRGGIAHLALHPAAKSEVLLRRGEILRAVRERFPERAVLSDIR